MIKCIRQKATEGGKLLRCSFTGHRQIKSSHKPEIYSLLHRAVEYAYSRGCNEFYSGGALGFDTLAAREVIRFRIDHPDVRLILLLPCIDQDKMWGESAQSSYEYLIDVADEVRYVSDGYTDDCMRRRNLALAEEADILIAYLGRARSGAAQTVRMAIEMGKEVYNLYPTLDVESTP